MSIMSKTIRRCELDAVTGGAVQKGRGPFFKYGGTLQVRIEPQFGSHPIIIKGVYKLWK